MKSVEEIGKLGIDKNPFCTTRCDWHRGRRDKVRGVLWTALLAPSEVSSGSERHLFLFLFAYLR